MFELDSIIQWLQGLPPLGVYVFLWFTTYIENLFPPSPSDVVMLFIATLIGMETIGFFPALWVATFGSVTGFLTAFVLGRKYGRKLFESERVPFLTLNSLEKVDRWFEKYGYWVIVANRFLAGTRAVISFVAGMSRLNFTRTTILCAVSALAWNILVLSLGAFLGNNWRAGEKILSQYGLAVTIILGALLLFFLIKWLVKRRRNKKDAKAENKD